MEIKQVKFFLQVCAEKSITTAAQKVFITQQAMSKAIAALEAELDVALFIRTKHGVRLTEEGEHFKILSKNLMMNYEKTLEDFRSLCALKKERVRCGASTGFGFYITPRLISDFRAHNPNVSLQIDEYPSDHCERMIVDGSLDVGVSLAPVDERQFHSVILRSHDMMAFVNAKHPLAGLDEIAISDLRGCELIASSEKNKQKLTGLCLAQGFAPNFVYTSTQSIMTYMLCSMYDYVGFSVEFIARNCIGNPNVKVMPFKDHAFLWEMCLYYKKGNELTDASKKLMRFLMEELKTPNEFELAMR